MPEVINVDETFLIVMLTHNDRTVENAYNIFEQCQGSKAEYWGFKEKPLPPQQMKSLYAYMKDCGKKTVLEVVAYTEKECMQGAEMAAEFGCDILMGTVFSDSVNELCKSCGIRYMPFVGEVSQRPSVLRGSLENMVAKAREYLAKGVYGIDLLGYRYIGNAVELMEGFISQVDAPVCIAGSINSYSRLDEIKRISPAAFTIGSAFFENRFGIDICSQINSVCDHMKTGCPGGVKC